MQTLQIATPRANPLIQQQIANGELKAAILERKGEDLSRTPEVSVGFFQKGIFGSKPGFISWGEDVRGQEGL